MKGALPFRLNHDSGQPEIEWILTDGSPFTEPFFEQTIARLRWQNPANSRSRRPRTPIDTLHDVPAAVSPTAFIFHISRCGSTLLAQTLAASPRNIVASEPQILDDIIQMARRNPPPTDGQRIAWLQGAVRSLGQRNPGRSSHPPAPERLFVKLDCWNIFALPLIQHAHPGVPLLFVYRHPLEVLVSLIRIPSITLIRGTVTPAQLGLSAEEGEALSREEHAAAILGAFYRAALAFRDSLVPVAYEALPRFAWESVPGCGCDDKEIEAMQAAARRDAKQPAEVFRPDAAAKRASASAPLVAAMQRFALPAYEAFVRTCTPVPD